MNNRRHTDVNSMLLAEKLSHLDKTLGSLAEAIKTFSAKGDNNTLEIVKLDERQRVANNRIKDLEGVISKIGWAVVLAVLTSLIGLVVK